MSEDRIAYVSCDFTNSDYIVLTGRNGEVLEDADVNQYDVIGLYHSDGPDAATDWIHCNKALVADLQANVFCTADIAVGPAESDLLEAEDCPAEDAPCGGECTGDCAIKNDDVEMETEPEDSTFDPDGEVTLGADGGPDDAELASVTADVDGDPDLDGLDSDEEE